MALIRPFRSIRPRAGLESEIAALPYDVYNREEARVEVERAPMSFLRIDRAETQLEPGTAPYDERVYEKARETLRRMVLDGSFVQDEKPCYYIYELTRNGRSQAGIAACASVDDYLNHVVKKHEETREDKEQDRIRHVDVCGAQTGPIFLAYRSDKKINEIVDRNKKRQVLYDFLSGDGVRHRVFRIDDPQDIEGIYQAFERIGEIYIADGHHRCASAVKVGLKRRERHPGYTGEEEFNFFLSVLFPDDQLTILSYNRAVKDLNGHTKEEFLSLIGEKYTVEPMGALPFQPGEKGEVSLCLPDGWYRLKARFKTEPTDPVKGLDVSVLQDQILNPILGIRDPRTDSRIEFIGGIRGLKELERRVAADCAAAFAMYPTSIEELFAVADAGLLMPPKSTWFEPKLRSGLFIHRIDGGEEESPQNISHRRK